jgi:predicted alpha/beta hydrolase family esterase
MTNFRIVFVHGWTASHTEDWYPNMAKELDKLDVDYVIPDLPGGEHPHAIDWLYMLHKIIETANKPIILVGQSLGTRAVLLYLEKYQRKVEKVFLIAALANRLENASRKNYAYPDFFDHVIDLEKIKSLVGKYIIMHSKNDPSIPIEQAVELSKDLNAELITYENNYHLNRPDDTNIILGELQKELNF